MTNGTETPRPSKKVVVTIYDDGDAEFEIDEGVPTMALYGIAGTLTMQGNVQMARIIAQAQKAQSGGIVVPFKRED